MSRRALPVLTAISLALALLTSGAVVSIESARNDAVVAHPLGCCG